MQERQLTAFLLPSTDPHQSEYVSARYEGRAWISGFTGSAGTLVVTQHFAGLWTDSRYFIQANAQLSGTGISMQKLRVPHSPEYIQWMQEQLPQGARVGFDDGVMSVRQVRRLEDALGENRQLVPTNDILDQIWSDRPPLPQSTTVNFSTSYAGRPRSEKLQEVVDHLKTNDLDAHLLVALDDIAWVLNIRANDVPFTPVCISYLLIHRSGRVDWCCDPDRLVPELRSDLEQAGIRLHPYATAADLLRALPPDYLLGVDYEQVSKALYDAVDRADVVHHTSPVAAWKSVKNDTEIRHLQTAMRKDGVALLRLRWWLDEQLAKGKAPSEYLLAQRLAELRSEQSLYQGESFPAIVGYGANGAIVHYKPELATSAEIRPSGLLLLDSGGQYLDGTTDCTRTYALSTPTDLQRRHFTLVLRGHINLARARFPKGTTGVQLDTLARQPLWQEGLNYGHGTGHGVGFFLNVHEGPHGISPNAQAKSTRRPFEAGTITSNEPGLYLEGQYGIRIENLILCVPDEQEDWLRFETLTLLPIDRQLIEPALLQRAEIDWLNAYHKRVFQELSPLLEPEEREMLKAACREVS